MSLSLCPQHPAARTVGGHCAACLLASAMPSAPPAVRPVQGAVTIQVPLGDSEAGRVFLVRGEPPLPNLLRLKTWRQPAPADFVERFGRLHTALRASTDPAIVAPLAAWVDDDGRPAVLTEFRRGVPLLEAVASGAVEPPTAAAHLHHLRQVTRQAHERGLAHGSIRSGNVFHDRTGSPYLLDFGLWPLVSASVPDTGWVMADMQGFAELDARLRASFDTGLS